MLRFGLLQCLGSSAANAGLSWCGPVLLLVTLLSACSCCGSADLFWRMDAMLRVSLQLRLGAPCVTARPVHRIPSVLMLGELLGWGVLLSLGVSLGAAFPCQVTLTLDLGSVRTCIPAYKPWSLTAGVRWRRPLISCAKGPVLSLPTHRPCHRHGCWSTCTEACRLAGDVIQDVRLCQYRLSGLNASAHIEGLGTGLWQHKSVYAGPSMKL